MGSFMDLAGRRFGRLTVLSVEKEKTASGNYRWHCICDCGEKNTLPSDHLVRTAQPVRSCGCLRNDRVREAVSPNPDEVAFRLLVGVYKKRARKKQIEFALSDARFRSLTSLDCQYCGAPPAMIIRNKSGSGQYIYNSIDRRDPSQGYTKNNSTPCCKVCNYMKWTLSEKEFLCHATVIAGRVRQCKS